MLKIAPTSGTNLSPSPADAQRFAEWKQSLNSQAVVVSDRNIGGTTADTAIQSIHTDEAGQWSGSVLWNDNHVAFENGGAKFETKYGNGPLNDIDTVADQDQLFIPDDGAADDSTNAAMIKRQLGGFAGFED